MLSDFRRRGHQHFARRRLAVHQAINFRDRRKVPMIPIVAPAAVEEELRQERAQERRLWALACGPLLSATSSRARRVLASVRSFLPRREKAPRYAPVFPLLCSATNTAKKSRPAPPDPPAPAARAPPPARLPRFLTARVPRR